MTNFIECLEDDVKKVIKYTLLIILYLSLSTIPWQQDYLIGYLNLEHGLWLQILLSTTIAVSCWLIYWFKLRKVK